VCVGSDHSLGRPPVPALPDSAESVVVTDVTPLAADDVVANRSAVFSPDAGLWIKIERANLYVYRGAGACGFYSIGGSLFGFSPVAHAEQHPDFDGCAGGADVPWPSADPLAASLEPGESVTVAVSLGGAVDQPCAYRAGLEIGHDTPHTLDEVEVIWTSHCRTTWARSAAPTRVDHRRAGQCGALDGPRRHVSPTGCRRITARSTCSSARTATCRSTRRCSCARGRRR
jgi:hypothetical protein